MFTVTIVEKGGTERRLTFDKEEVSIGRISGNDIILPKGNISKRHARVVVKDARFIVIDLKSTNGTYVNKERISAPRVITADDQIYIGDFVMRLNSGIRGVEADGPTVDAQQPDAFFSPEPAAAAPAATEHQPPAVHPGSHAMSDLESEEATRAVALSDVEAMLAGGAPIEFGAQPAGAPTPQADLPALKVDAPLDEVPIVEGEDSVADMPLDPAAAVEVPVEAEPQAASPWDAAPPSDDNIPVVMPESEAEIPVVEPEDEEDPIIDLEFEDPESETLRPDFSADAESAEAAAPDADPDVVDFGFSDAPELAAPAVKGAAAEEDADDAAFEESDFSESGFEDSEAASPETASPETSAQGLDSDAAEPEVSEPTVADPVAASDAEEATGPDAADAEGAPDEDAPDEHSASEVSDEDEDPFDGYVRVLSLLHDRCQASVFAEVDPDELDLSDSLWAELEKAVSGVVAAARGEGLVPAGLEDSTLTQDLLYEFTGLGPVEYFLADDHVDALMVNDFDQLFVAQSEEANGARTNPFYKSFSSPAALERAVDKLATSLGFAYAERPAIMSGDLPDGTRFQIVLPPLTTGGPSLVFKKAPAVVHTIQSFLERGAVSDEMVQYLFARVAERANVVVTGRRGTGRGALLNALGYFIPESDRIVMVDDGAELALPHGNVIRLRLPELPDERADLFDIMPTLLADRLVVGEATGATAVALLNLALAGAEGVLFTSFATSPEDLAVRLATQAQVTGLAPNRESADALVGRALDVVVHLQSDGERVRVADVAEVRHDGSRLVLETLFRWDSSSQAFVRAK